MLPATNLEKFVARVLLVAVIYPLTICAAFIVADGLQLLISMLIAPEESFSMVVAYFDIDTYVSADSPLWTKALSTLMIYSIAIFGGLLFRKVSLAEVDSCLFYCDYSFSYRLFLLKVSTFTNTLIMRLF